MDWGGKRGEGAGKLTLDISHLNAAAIVIRITVKAVGGGRRAECATRGVSVARLRARRAPLLNYYFPGGYDSSTGRTRRYCESLISDVGLAHAAANCGCARGEAGWPQVHLLLMQTENPFFLLANEIAAGAAFTSMLHTNRSLEYSISRAFLKR